MLLIQLTDPDIYAILITTFLFEGVTSATEHCVKSGCYSVQPTAIIVPKFRKRKL